MKKLSRYNLNKSMKNFLSFPISLISTPGGFGKTTSVLNFLDSQDIYSIWFSMNGELDEEWVFKKIMRMLNVELSFFPEYVSHIPTTRKEIDDFMTQLEKHLDKHLFIVFDDVTVSKIPTFMKMLKTYSFNSFPFVHFIIITRDTIQNEAFAMNADSCFIMTSKDFILDKNEIIQLFKNEFITVSNEDIDYIYQYTNGWFTAIQLALESHKKYHSFYESASINALIREVFYNSLSPEVQVSLIKLSILKDFTLPQALDLCENKEILETIIKLEAENYFIQSVDFHKYSIIPLLKEFLNNELLLLSIDINALYNKTGMWYFNHDLPIDAIKVFMQSHNYDAIINIIEKYNDISFTDISPQLMTEVFSSLPNEYKNTHPYVYLKWILDCITNLPWLNGENLLEDFKYRLESKQLLGDTKKLLGEYYFIHAFTYYNDVSKMLEDFIQAYNYFDGGYSQFAYPFMIATFGSYHVLYLYYNRVGKLQNIVDEIQKNSHYFIHISQGINTGANEQVIAELAYETGQYANVSSYAIVAYDKSKVKNQVSIAISSLFLQGRLALMQFNHEKYETIIKQLRGYYNYTKIPILQCEVECALSYLYILNNQDDLVPTWLKYGQLEYASLLHEASLITAIVYGLYLVKEKNYEKLDMISDIIENTNKEQIHVLGIIYAKLYKTISCYQRNFSTNALHYFKEVMQLCISDHIISPIVELSFAFEGLLDLYIPKNGFEYLVIQSSKEHLLNYHKAYTNKLHNTSLTSKELTVLSMIAKNKTLKQISNELQISTNTVQTHMKAIYRKLNINTKVEAIRYYEKNQ